MWSINSWSTFSTILRSSLQIMTTNLFLQHPLFSRWPLYITAREGFLRHESSWWAAWESRLPIFKWVRQGKLSLCLSVLKANNKVSCWSLSKVVNPFLFLFLFFFLPYFLFVFGLPSYSLFVISLHRHAHDVKLFFHSFVGIQL